MASKEKSILNKSKVLLFQSMHVRTHKYIYMHATIISNLANCSHQQMTKTTPCITQDCFTCMTVLLSFAPCHQRNKK